MAKLPSGQLPTVQIPNDIGITMGHAPGAVDWFAECVNNYGADSVFVLSVVHSKRLRALFLDFLFVQDGLLHAAGIPRASLVWANSRSDPALCPEWPHPFH